MQEFAQYDDWRIEKNMTVLDEEIRQKCKPNVAQEPLRRLHALLYGPGHLPGGRDALEEQLSGACQERAWSFADQDRRRRHAGLLAVRRDNSAASPASFTRPPSPVRPGHSQSLLPILQEGKIESLRRQLQEEGKGITTYVVSSRSIPAFRCGGRWREPVTAAVAIHLLNRRRYKVVQWAAMDFLRQAMRAQPPHPPIAATCCCCCSAWPACCCSDMRWPGRILPTPRPRPPPPHQPVHAVLLVDNSLSTSYQKLNGMPLLDDIKHEAEKIIKDMPPGGRFRWCRYAVRRRPPTTRACYTRKMPWRPWPPCSPSTAATRPAEGIVNLAASTCQRLPELPVKQIYLLTNQQAGQWSGRGGSRAVAAVALPAANRAVYARRH